MAAEKKENENTSVAFWASPEETAKIDKACEILDRSRAWLTKQATLREAEKVIEESA